MRIIDKKMAWPPRIFNAGPRLCTIIVNQLLCIVKERKEYHEELSEEQMERLLEDQEAV